MSLTHPTTLDTDALRREECQRHIDEALNILDHCSSMPEQIQDRIGYELMCAKRAFHPATVDGEPF